MTKTIPPFVTRIHRALLAAIENNQPAQDLALHEIGDCPCCQRRAIKYLVNLLALEMTHENGDRNGAITWLENTITESLDAQQQADR